MSYILEALRKVELQREHLPAHGLSSRRRYNTAVPAIAARPRTLLVVFAAAAGALFSGVLAIYLMADKKNVQPVISATSGLEQTLTTPATHEITQKPVPDSEAKQTPLQVASGLTLHAPESPSRIPAAGVALREKEPEVANPQSKAPMLLQEGRPSIQQSASLPRHRRSGETSSEHIASSKTRGTSQSQNRKHPSHSVKDLPVEQGDSGHAPAPNESDTTKEPALLATLSPQIQSMVPKISIDGVIYSDDPTQSVVVINMKLYNEGQKTPEGITVEAIRQDSVICSYQGQRFRLPR